MDDAPFFVIRRKIIEDPLYYLEPFTKIQAWLDMIRMANWNNGSFESGLDQIKLDRGEFIHTEDHLSKTWGWSRGKVRRFIKWCESDERISVRKMVLVSGQTRNIVKLVNYERYQFPVGGSGTSVGTSNSTSIDTSNGTQEKENTKKKKKENTKISNDIVREIIEDLNKKCKKKFDPELPKWRDLIQARFNESKHRTVKDFKEVNSIKKKQWIHSPKYNKYLRPSTLYGTKFEEYLNETEVTNIWSPDLYNNLPLKENNMSDDYQNPIPNKFTNIRKVVKQELSKIGSEEELNQIWEQYSTSWKQDFKIQEMYDKRLAELSDTTTPATI